MVPGHLFMTQSEPMRQFLLQLQQVGRSGEVSYWLDFRQQVKTGIGWNCCNLWEHFIIVNQGETEELKLSIINAYKVTIIQGRGQGGYVIPRLTNGKKIPKVLRCILYVHQKKSLKQP